MKTYTVVGVSTRKNRTAVRYSNADPVVRGRVMLATGNTQIALYRLPQPMTKSEAHDAFLTFDCEGVEPAFKSADYPV
jgi:hypothetical protein